MASIKSTSSEPIPLILRLVPIISWLPKYQRKWLRLDIFAGSYRSGTHILLGDGKGGFEKMMSPENLKIESVMEGELQEAYPIDAWDGKASQRIAKFIAEDNLWSILGRATQGLRHTIAKIKA